MTALLSPMKESRGCRQWFLMGDLLDMDQELGGVVHPLKLGTAAIRELGSVANQEPLEFGSTESRYEAASDV